MWLIKELIIFFLEIENFVVWIVIWMVVLVG